MFVSGILAARPRMLPDTAEPAATQPKENA